jgi:hypothetical protein
LCGLCSSTRGSYTSPQICFLAIDHILVFLVLAFGLKWSFMAISDKNGGFCGHLSLTRGSFSSPHICFLAIDHILGFLVETILGKKSVGFSLRYCCKWLFILFSTKIRVVWPLVISQRLVHITPHMVACHRSHSWISGGDHLLVKNPKVLAFGII